MPHEAKLEMLDECKQECLKWSIKVHEAKVRLKIAGLRAERDRFREIYAIMLKYGQRSDKYVVI